MNLGIIGTGYVGLVSGVCFAEYGNNVICMDIDEKKIERLRTGDPVIYEPQLEELLNKNISERRISFTTSLKDTVRASDIIFLCLPTPPNKNGSADLSMVLNVAKNLSKYINGYKIIVSKSTVPVGTCAKIRKIISKKTKHDFDAVSNPEFLKEGAAVSDFMSPDRVVVGTKSKKAAEILRGLYSSFMRVSERFLLMDEKSAELTKYAANSMLALRISFMNELANMCEKAQTDIDMVRIGIGSDPRIGNSFLFPGTGYGGSCFPKDVKGLIKCAQEFSYDFKILKTIDSINENQKLILVNKIKNRFGSKLKGKIITVWGLAYKPRTDDIREAPSITIIENLLKAGAKIQAFDPAANQNMKKYFKYKLKHITFFENNYDALKNSNALVLVTEWNEFRKPDFDKMKALMNDCVIFDGRNIYDPQLLKSQGFEYYGIGR
ncbi:MAG: UDP-glucose dehydrogenase family protein [Ignavibacteria bacterium]